MKYFRLCAIAGLLVIPGSHAAAQSTIDVLYQELNTVKQQQADMSSQSTTNFFSQVDAGMESNDAAVQLYQAANGPMPDPSPIVTTHEDESASEKAARLALDQSNVTKLGLVLQLQLGLMHYGGLFILDPKRQGLQEAWAAWLQKAAQVYTQIGDLTPGVPGAGAVPGAVHHHHHANAEGGEGEAGGGGAPAAPAAPPARLNLAELKSQAISNSIIVKYLSFQAFGSSDQGQWSVSGIPGLYKTAVLDPSRTSPTAETLTKWDIYIAMLNADQKDQDTWNQTIYPPLAFNRALDDYAIEPNTEKLEGLIKLVSAYPTYPGAKDWLAQIKTMIDAYKSQHAPAPADTPAAAAPATNSAVSVTQVQQGDAMIITTHTNSAPVNPAPH
jgi:hypothetical protein